MPGRPQFRFRAVLAVLAIAVVAFAGALYLGYRSGMRAAQVGGAGTAVAALGLQNVDDPQLFNEHLVEEAYSRLLSVYYKPVPPDVPLRGEHNGILSFLDDGVLKGKHPDATLPSVHATGDAASNVQGLDRQLQIAQRRYAARLGSSGKTKITQAALRGIMSSVRDPYTVYLSPTEIAKLQESLSGGNFGGIGVYIYQLKNGEILLQPIMGLPAARAGMKPGDVLTSVDGVSVKNLSLDRVERMIRGQEGTAVVLQTHLYGKTAVSRYRIVRQIIHVPTVYAKMEGPYDYIRLTDFGQTSAQEVRKALIDGKAHHAKGYILDLRDNGGGLLEAAVQISSDFIPRGTIVSTIDREGATDRQSALGDAISGLQPLVVLVNKYTASASEITSGAIQDYRVGTIVGTQTFGKGVVQSIYPMPDGGALKITTARYVTPLGRDIEHKGITPDIVVRQSDDPSLIDTPRDKQLAAAKAQLAREIR